MFRYDTAFAELVAEYKSLPGMYNVQAPASWGDFTIPDVTDYRHSRHPEFCMRLQEIHDKWAWARQAKQQMFVAEQKSLQKALKPEVGDRLVALTVRPEDGSLDTCKEIIERIKKISAVQKMVYVFEQKQENENESPHGWHIHAAITTSYTPSNIKVYVGQVTYKKRRGTIVCSVHTTKADYKWQENYMRGDKHNESKDAAVRCDRIFRERLGLQSMYEFTREVS